MMQGQIVEKPKKLDIVPFSEGVNNYVFLRDIINELNADRSHFIRWVRKNGFEIAQARDIKGRLMLAVSRETEKEILKEREQQGYCVYRVVK